jgi:hypothetical protein
MPQPAVENTSTDASGVRPRRVSRLSPVCELRSIRNRRRAVFGPTALAERASFRQLGV